jgi:hypothetical protein
MLKFMPAERLTIDDALKSSLFQTPAAPSEAQVKGEPAVVPGIGDCIADWLNRAYGPSPESEQHSSSSPLPFPPSDVRFDFEGITGTTSSLEPFIEAEVRGARSGLHRAVSDAPLQSQCQATGHEMQASAGHLTEEAVTAVDTSPTQVPAAKRPRTSDFVG